MPVIASCCVVNGALMMWWSVYTQVYYQLILTIIDLHMYSYMFLLQPVGILRELQYSETYIQCWYVTCWL